MRKRQSARLLVVSPQKRILLFKYVYNNGALAGGAYWATPGGGVEPGESFESTAIRELFEETGIRVQQVDAPVANREVRLLMSDGEEVLAIERYFAIQATDEQVSYDGWTRQEVNVIAEHRWWSKAELAQIAASLWPEDLIGMLDDTQLFA